MTDSTDDGLSGESSAIFFGSFPAGTSERSILHLLDMVDKKKFCRWDYGKAGNLKNYGQEEPPQFAVEKIRDMPIALFWGKADLITCEEDANWLKELLKSQNSLLECKDYENLGHLGVLMPNEEHAGIFKDLVELLQAKK
jgi:alpha-beta hydrolase superfamily lysophospholipase